MSMLGLSNDQKGTGGVEGSSSAWFASLFSSIRDAGLFSFDGRIGRADFWVRFLWGNLLFLIPLFVASLIAGILMAIAAHFFSAGIIDSLSEVFFVLLILSFFAGCIWVNLANIVKRIHDLNLSGWFIFVAAITYPFSLVILGLVKGTNGPNRYGEDLT